MTPAVHDAGANMKKKRGLVSRWIRRQRWLQRITGIHLVHHPRWSFGWSFPFTSLVRFEAYSYTEHMVFRADYGEVKIRPAHWQRCTRASYHDCSATGRY